MDVRRITRVEIKTNSIIGSFFKTFMEEVIIDKHEISFRRYWIDPTHEEVAWSSKSNTDDRLVHFYLFLETLQAELKQQQFHKEKEFTRFCIRLYEGEELIFKDWFQGTFEMNNLKYSKRMLERMMPDCEVKPMYLLPEVEYKLEAEDFGEETMKFDDIKEA